MAEIEFFFHFTYVEYQILKLLAAFCWPITLLTPKKGERYAYLFKNDLPP